MGRKVFEVDGITYDRMVAAWNRETYMRRMFDVLDPVEDFLFCEPDASERCVCQPREYVPLPFEYGEICEQCWIRRAVVHGAATGCRPDAL